MMRCAACALLLCFSTLVDAAADPVRPRVGLVLGGGGARGLAHLGVIEELEKMRIPISCIAGTSAGALVGGSYATGQPLTELIAKVEAADWDRLLSGSPDRRGLPFPAKINDYKNLAGITMGVDLKGVHLPRSVVGSQDIDRFLRELTQDTYLKSFDALPIPFRAIATNLITGEVKVFDQGDLAIAMRASMAVPGAFDLVELDDQLYVDGMFVRNLPVEDVKGRCADIVIAVDVGMPTLKAGDIHSIFDIAAQSMNVATGRNVIEQRKLLGPQDILIKPPLEGFTPADFALAKGIVARGRLLSDETRERLSALSLDEASYARWQTGLGAYLAQKRDGYDRLEIADTRYVPANRVRERIEKPRMPETQSELQARLDSLHESGDFDRINYFLREENGQRVATVMPMERNTGPNYLRFGTEIRLDTYRKSDIALLGNFQMTWLNTWGAQWRNDVRLGSDSSLASELYQPLGDSAFFLSANGRLGTRTQPIYDKEGSRVSDIGSTNSTAGAELGYALGRYGEFRLGGFIRRSDLGVETGPTAGADEVSVRDRGWRGLLLVDQLDNPRFPRRGYYMLAEYQLSDTLASSDVAGKLRVLRLSGDVAETIGKTTWRASMRYADSDGPGLTAYSQLGGFLQLSGLQTDQLLGRKSAFGRLMAYSQISPLMPALGTGTYLGASLELGRMFKQPSGDEATNIIPSASLWVGLDTFMGPLYLGAGWSNYNGARIAGYLYLGYAP